ncbi:uncharacterized protein L203_101343 [Cryptococcus depauperatus CBS 7841]|uniref:HbrB-like protein n=1 Tax=Cryptococcus depauperatus CBS 7841 TaxID=1295531 RepID=A0AAJ8JPL6_9TREE
MSRQDTYHNASSLSIRPSSPTTSALYSPRRNPLPPSPTYSARSYTSSGKTSSGIGMEQPPPVPKKDDIRRPPLPTQHSRGWAVGVYDNKFVSSTLSHLPPIPSSTHAANPTTSRTTPSSSSALVVFPDGTPLSDHSVSGHEQWAGKTAENLTVQHTSPSSPWSLLTVHVLPLFAGSALKTPIEDLKWVTFMLGNTDKSSQLCHSHIVSTSQRSPPARIVALLSADLRDFIASGMLTLKAKFETLEEEKVVGRAAEVWSFFWTQILPYVEGVFLPFTQLRDVPTNASAATPTLSSTSPIPVRHLLLSGFMLHILLPLLPRLIPQILPRPNTPLDTVAGKPAPSAQDLARILQMSLVLSTQAKYSSFFPTSSAPSGALTSTPTGNSAPGPTGQNDPDEEVRSNVDSLGQSVWYRIQMAKMEAMGEGGSKPGSPAKGGLGSSAEGGTTGVGTVDGPGGAAGTRASVMAPRGNLGLQHKLSTGKRLRRRGWRASTYLSQHATGPFAAGVEAVGGIGVLSRQNSNFAGSHIEHPRWARYDIEEDDDVFTSNVQPIGHSQQNALGRRMRGDTTDSSSSVSINSTSSMISSQIALSAATGSSALTSGTGTPLGDIQESFASYGETSTPSASVINGMGRGMEKGYGRAMG